MNSTCIMLALLGIAEIVLIFAILLGGVALIAGAVFLTVWLSQRSQRAAPLPAATAQMARCPRCGSPLPTAAPQGLCPRCVLQVGLGTKDASEPAFRDASGKPNPPDPGELAKHFPQLEILALLGQGGMGAVYKARQKDLDRLVALKILPAGNGRDPAFAERFMREARALAKLSHPNIVAVHDFGQLLRGAGVMSGAGAGEGAPGRAGEDASAPRGVEAGAASGSGKAALLYYFIMEFVDGPNLRQLMQGQKLSPQEALAIVPQICAALQFAHDEGIVHRDIKPENILLDTKGRVRIADFGIAKIVVKGRDATLTGAKDVIGTPHYMAPEQVERPTEVDHRADIYSLGVVFYEMLTGELPLGKFALPSHKVQVDVRLDEVVLHALEKEPERRYQHASEVKTDVEALAQPSSAEQSGWESRAPGWRIRCVKCGFTEPWGKYGLQLGAVGKKYTLGRCSRCGGIRIHAIERGEAEKGRAGSGAQPSLPPMAAMHASQPGTGPRRPDGIPATGGGLPPWLLAVRWSARVLGTLLLAFYGFFVVAEGLPPIATQPEGVQLNFIALGLMLGGFAVGWKREGTAALLIAAGWALWHVSEGRLQWNLFQTPLPVASLYAYCWWELRGRRTRVLVTTVVILAAVFGLGWLLVPTSVFVRGSVLDAETRQPVPQVELRLLSHPTRASGEDDAPHARSTAQGRFTLYVGWYAEAKELVLSAPGYQPLTTNLGPRALGARKVSRDFLLHPTGQSVGAGMMLSGPVPPVVVRTMPASGSRDIDPALTELRVSFSKPMREGSWSWVKLEDRSFPVMTGASHYQEDHQTCVLPVKLEPGRVYAVWINLDQFQGFQDRDGLPAVPYLLIFETRK